eukprot:TRINITY_DN43467_c0_g1_i1.p1 TRINITY_DN43467_c0_g1~~TRINITY_DN43467_c0_g1_i1.p1  ORF type:complete len:593 (-),score=115.42 TRINITY_DN43467_c0_g1_i1:75-1826(-)
MESRQPLADHSIVDFYTGKNVLVTGCTGFVGKVLLEKLLWELCAPAFEKGASSQTYSGPVIKLLVRASREASGQERFLELVNGSPAFHRLQLKHGGSHESRSWQEFLQQCVEVVDGDLESDSFGLDASSYDHLCGSVDVIMHCAALVAWGAPLDASLRCNSAGSKRIAKFAKDARGVSERPVRLVVVSTAWVHGMRKGSCPEWTVSRLCGKGSTSQDAETTSTWPALEPHTEMEHCLAKAAEFQETSLASSKLAECQREAARRLGPHAELSALKEAAEDIRSRSVEANMVEWGLQRARHFGWWDGYTFSKALGELFVEELQGDVPYAVVRPSGVVSAAAEPVPGWVDAYLLVEPLIEGVGRGQITSFPGDPNCVIDCVPVDFVCNVILAAAAKLPSTPCAPEDAAHVYQVASGDVYPNKLGDIESTWRDYFEHCPMQDAQGRSVQVRPVEFAADAETFAGSFRRYTLPLHACVQALEMMPFWDRMAVTRNARGWLEKKRRGIEKVLGLARLYSTYTLNAWSFKTGNSRSLMENLSSVDQARFPYFPTESWDWANFWSEKHIPGMRRWVLKEHATQPAQLTSKL